jgi:hypothetical protein
VQASTPVQEEATEHAARPVFPLFFTGKIGPLQAVSTLILRYGPDGKGKKGFQGKETVVSFPWGFGVKCRRIVEQAKAPRSILVCPA